jgi:phage-related protein
MLGMSAIKYIDDSVYNNNYLIFDKVPSSDFRVVVSGAQTWEPSERDVEEIEIPGRNGNLIVDKKRYKNKEHPYTCTILEDWKQNYEAFKDWLMCHSDTYYRLEDTYHPNEYLMAKFNTISDLSYDDWIGGGTFTITFNRKPQRFLKDEEPRDFTANGSIHNPTNFPSSPLLYVWGNGSFAIGGQSVTVTNNANNYITIDTEIMNAYRESANQNSNVALPLDPITIASGNVGITLNGVTRVRVYPRWWKL